MMMKSHTTRFLSLALAFVLIVSLCVPAFAAGADSFTDVKTTAWYYSDVAECAALGIVAGYEDGSFLPDDNVTSIQFLTMLTRTFYASELDQIAVPAGQPWYYANTTVASNVGMSDNMAAIDNTAINRYEMALVLYNTLAANGKAITAQQRLTATASITDYSSIPTSYRTPVIHCYAHGIITGMEDGSFAGTQSMTRAQACTVIMRMLKLINNYNPGDKDNDVYDDGTSQNTGNNQQSGKLANGKDATVDNVLEILDQLEQEYPDGTIWGDRNTPGTKSYAAGNKSTDVLAVTNQFKSTSGLNTSTQYGCGGFAAMVSDRIFGQTGAPAREVTDPSKVRPGDIAILFNSNGQLTHVAIASGSAQPITGLSGATYYGFTTCDGNVNGGYVEWGRSYSYLGAGTNGSSVRAWTRYPEALS